LVFQSSDADKLNEIIQTKHSELLLKYKIEKIILPNFENLSFGLDKNYQKGH